MKKLFSKISSFFSDKVRMSRHDKAEKKGATNEFDQVVQGNSLTKDAWRRLRKNKAAVVGMCVVIIYALISLCAGILPIYSYEEIIIDHQYLPPSLTRTAGELMMKRQLSELYATAWRQGRLAITSEENAMLSQWIENDKTSRVWDWCYEEGQKQLAAGTFSFNASEQKKVDKLEESIKSDIQVTVGLIRWTDPETGKTRKLEKLDLMTLVEIYSKVLGGMDTAKVNASLESGVTSQMKTEVKAKNAEMELTSEELDNLVSLEIGSIGQEGFAAKQIALAINNIEAMVQSSMKKQIKAEIKEGTNKEFPYKATEKMFDCLDVQVEASLKNQRRYILGTDNLGRDLLSRIIYGGRISILIGIVGTLTSLFIGIVMGSIAGYFGGRVDYYIMRFVDVLYGLPYMLLVIICMAIFGTNILNLFFALAMVSWLTIARMVRGQIMSLKNQEYIEAARSMGAGGARIIFKHLVPNSLSVIIVYSTLRVPEFIMQESFLSFLGLGVQAPLSSWGSLIGDSTQGMTNYPWRLIYPALVMTVFLFSMNFFGDGLRDAFDPQSKNML